MTQFVIDVVYDPSRAIRGSRRVDRALDATERRSRSLGRSLNNAFAVIGITTLITQLVRLSDTYTNSQNRLRLVTTGTAQLVAVQKELFAISNSTRSSFEATATIYSRTALSVRELGISHRDTLSFVESLNHAIILSGVNAREASNGLIQLSQGIASNTLRGDELRAVLEQLPAVADVIAKHFKIGRGELRLLGAQGKISGEDIIDAFKSSADELERLFKITVPTIGQAFDVLKNRSIEAVGNFNDFTGAADGLAIGIITLADNLDNLGKIAIIAGAALAGPFAKAGVGVAIVAVKALTIAIATNPIGALVVIVLAGVTALVQFGDQISVSTTRVSHLGDVFSVIWDIIKEGVDDSISFLKGLGDVGFAIMSTIFDALPKSIRNADISFRGFLKAVARNFDAFIGVLAGIVNVIVVLVVDSFQEMSNNVKRIFASLVNKVIDQLNDVLTNFNKVREALSLDPIDLLDLIEVPEKRIDSVFNDIGKHMGMAFNAAVEQSTLATDALGKVLVVADAQLEKFNDRVRKRTIDRLVDERRAQDRARRAAITLDDKPDIVDRVPLAFKRQIELLEAEFVNMQKINSERAIANKLLSIANSLRASTTKITDPQQEELNFLVRRNQNKRDEIALIKSIRGEQVALTKRQEDLNDAHARGAITLVELNREMEKLLFIQAQINIDSGEGSFVDGFMIGMEQMLENVRNFKSVAGELFADFFTGVAEGFSDAIANSIIFGESLSESIGNASRELLASLLSGLINIGAQFLLNKVFEQTATASSLVGIASVTTAEVAATTTKEGVALAALATSTAAVIASNLAIAASAAAPAALVSLASYGANAIPAQAGIATTVALSKALSVPGFKDGGFIQGAGGPRSDSINANLSNGEFVVNAKSTARFRPQLESINNAKGFAHGGAVDGSSAPSQASNDQLQSSNQTRIINILDPSLLGDFLSTPEGEEVIINVINRNSDRIVAR